MTDKTREEAAEKIRDCIALDGYELALTKDFKESLFMALEALEQQPCEEQQEQTRDEKMIDAIDFAIKATNSQDDYSMGMRNGMKYVKSLIDGKEPQYEIKAN